MNPDSDFSSLWYIPAVTVQLADGATLVKPGKAIQRASPAICEKLTGISARSLGQLADEGFIRRGNPTRGKVYYYPAEVIELTKFIEKNPDFWSNPKTRQAYLQSKEKTEPQS